MERSKERSSSHQKIETDQSYFIPVDSTLMNRLSGDASRCVHVQVADGVGVGVGNPGHLSLASAHV